MYLYSHIHFEIFVCTCMFEGNMICTCTCNVNSCMYNLQVHVHVCVLKLSRHVRQNIAIKNSTFSCTVRTVLYRTCKQLLRHVKMNKQQLMYSVHVSTLHVHQILSFIDHTIHVDVHCTCIVEDK